MKHLLLTVILLALPLALSPQNAPAHDESDSAPKVDAGSAPADLEEQALRASVREANGSQVDLIRVLEKHLAQHPDSRRREEIELVLFRSAVDLNDDARIAKYGVLFLDTGANDISVMDRVIPILLRDPSESTAKRALQYAKRYEIAAQDLDNNRPEARGLLPTWKRRRDRAFARAFVFQARAEGNLGNLTEALKLAKRSYEIDPSAESAREIGRWYAKGNQLDEALTHYADAFAIEDTRNDTEHREADLSRLRELYAKKGLGEIGLGDLLLAAYDRTRAVVSTKEAEINALAPNAAAQKPSEFVLSSIDGESLSLASLSGKVVVLDFWATWCGPCRMQQPLYEEVKKRFAGTDDVRFLSVNTDEDRAAVEPFIEENNWPRAVYFEDGLAEELRISSIPTTVILRKDGTIFSRMNGFIPEEFVDQLSARLNEALEAESTARVASAAVSVPPH
ncbi:MAG: TlpA family protein disulfide reductase [Bryobacterales bacterium]|nr:TlpA family protein disulfide reductase [Bryobacterales bacterium]